MSSDQAIAEIEALEAQRVEALTSNNLAKLKSLIAEDLVHVHANGTMENKAEYLDAVANKYEFIKIDRPSLNIRLIDNVAIVTGPLNQHVRLRVSDTLIDMKAFATQVWVKQADGWVQNSFHATRVE